MIKVKNISTNDVYVIAHDMKFRRKLAPGREIGLDKDVYDELTFDTGFEKFVRNGILRVSGVNEIESEVIESPFTVLSADEIQKIFEEKDYAKFTKSIQNASPATKDSIVELAVKMRITDNAFVTLINKYIGINVVEAIATQAQAEEK